MTTRQGKKLLCLLTPVDNIKIMGVEGFLYSIKGVLVSTYYQQGYWRNNFNNTQHSTQEEATMAALLII